MPRHEITRLEAFSDAVFGFALTLLVVSLEVPRSYAELMDVMAGFPAFACCFALLVWIWHEHNAFFRRYGLQDNVTILINAALLFVVLFYVYPLKFMFDSMFARFVPRAHPPEPMALFQLANASVVYAIGFILMMLMFVLLYARAYARRRDLELTELDVFDLMSLAGHMVVSTLVGFVALSIAALAPLAWAPLSPASLCLMGPGHFLWGAWHGRRRRALEARIAASGYQTVTS
ncbi:MAG TPA: TMEM175 family protein [Vicinamibacterales bacterium]|nr:TMEM175 family protein [Vicinamibacterales bacterium]